MPHADRDRPHAAGARRQDTARAGQVAAGPSGEFIGSVKRYAYARAMTHPFFLRVIVTAAALLPGLTGTALANDFVICRDQSGDVAIAACSRAIASSTLSQASRAYAFYNRGVEYKAKGNFDGALADFTQAIRLRPGVPEYFTARGLVHEERRDIAAARADFTQALSLRDEGDNFAWAKKTAREHLGKLGK